MKIVIISGTAPPEPLTASRLNWDLAMHLAKGKNKVWLISPKPSRPIGANYPKLSGTCINKLAFNLYHVQTDSFTYPKHNLLLRAYESLDFGMKSISYVNRMIKNYDLIYSSSWPFFSQLMIVLLRKNKKVPLIMNIQDLYPESFLSRIKPRALSKIFQPLYLIDRVIASESTHITVISESFKKAYLEKRKVCESKISIIHNWQDPDEFKNVPDSREEVIKKYNLQHIGDRFIFMYLGNIGPVAGVETILHSFSRLKNDKSCLIIAGSGSDKIKCQQLASRLKIANLTFLEVPPGLKHVVELQSISDVLLLPINPEATKSSIPSKLIAYMFSSKPVITSGTGINETAAAIKASECGWITRTNDPADWAVIMDLACNTDKETRDEMGKSGFDYAIRNFSKTEGLNRINLLINRIAVE